MMNRHLLTELEKKVGKKAGKKVEKKGKRSIGGTLVDLPIFLDN